MIYLRDEKTGVTVEHGPGGVTASVDFDVFSGESTYRTQALQDMSEAQADALLRGLLRWKMHSLQIGDDRKRVSHFIVWLETGR